MMNEPMMPGNIEAEKCVLGSLLIDVEAIREVAPFLEPLHFYRDAHRTIYATILHLYERNEPADYITLSDTLTRQGRLDEVGGDSYLISLISIVPTSAHVENYARIVKQAAIRRRLIHAASQIAASAYQEEDANIALERAEALLHAVTADQVMSDFESGQEIMDPYLERLWDMKQGQSLTLGMSTGFTDLDFCLGGLQKSDLIIVAARPAVGKSSWALSLAYHAVVNEGKRVGYVSLEMGKEQLIQRLISMDTHIPSNRIRIGDIRHFEWDKVADSRQRLASSKLWIDDTGGTTISALRSKVLRLHARYPLDCIIVDYLQLMKGSGKNENRVLEIGEISMGLKNLAKELNIPVVALAQLSRAVESRQSKVPQLSDLRESGSIENDADIVMFIYRDELYNPNSERKGIADIIVAKHRNGPTGEIALGFQREETRFHNLEETVPGLTHPNTEEE